MDFRPDDENRRKLKEALMGVNDFRADAEGLAELGSDLDRRSFANDSDNANQLASSLYRQEDIKPNIAALREAMGHVKEAPASNDRADLEAVQRGSQRRSMDRVSSALTGAFSRRPVDLSAARRADDALEAKEVSAADAANPLSKGNVAFRTKLKALYPDIFGSYPDETFSTFVASDMPNIFNAAKMKESGALRREKARSEIEKSKAENEEWGRRNEITAQQAKERAEIMAGSRVAAEGRAEKREIMKEDRQRTAKQAEKKAEAAGPGGYMPTPGRIPDDTQKRAFSEAYRTMSPMQATVDELERLHAKFGSSPINPEARAKMESLVQQLSLSFKSKAMAELGVLAGPDMPIIRGVVPDASDPREAFKEFFGQGTVSAKLKALREAIPRYMKSAAEAYGYSPTKKLKSGETAILGADGEWEIMD